MRRRTHSDRFNAPAASVERLEQGSDALFILLGAVIVLAVHAVAGRAGLAVMLLWRHARARS
jgi:hypothetical protein